MDNYKWIHNIIL